jgi:hypothetical protein
MPKGIVSCLVYQVGLLGCISQNDIFYNNLMTLLINHFIAICHTLCFLSAINICQKKMAEAKHIVWHTPTQ